MKVRCISEPLNNGDSIKIGDIYTVRSEETISTGTWYIFEELPLNKYCVRNAYLSLNFEKLNPTIREELIQVINKLEDYKIKELLDFINHIC